MTSPVCWPLTKEVALDMKENEMGKIKTRTKDQEIATHQPQFKQKLITLLSITSGAAASHPILTLYIPI